MTAERPEDRIEFALSVGVVPEAARQNALRAVAALVAERDAAVEALQEAEWNGSAWIGMSTCPVCSNEREDGHAKDCSIAAALGVAVGEPEQDREGNNGGERADSRSATAPSEIGADALPSPVASPGVSDSAANCPTCGRAPYGSTPGPNPTTKYLCPYCNEVAVLRDEGVVVDRFRNVCHEECLGDGR